MITRFAGITLALIAAITGNLPAQERSSTYQVLHVPANAPLMALGSYNITWGGANPAQFISNPALVSDSLNSNLGFSYIAFSGAFNMATANYHRKAGPGNASVGVRYLSFGEMQGYDAAGNPMADFKAGQTALTFGYQMSTGNYSYGANMDIVSIGMAGYNSNALSFSLGGLFIHPNHDLTIGATIKNLGFILTDFSETSDSKIPWDAQIGITFKPEYMPFRFSITGHHLFNNNLLDDSIEKSISKELLSHAVVGAELVLSRNISIMAGYNHLIRQELKLQQTAGSAGFSYGFLWQTKYIQFAYGRGAYHVAGASHVFSLNLDLNRVFSKI